MARSPAGRRATRRGAPDRGTTGPEASEGTAARLLRTVAEMRRFRAELRRQGRSVGFVPTMGALHEGHLSLLDLARERADVAGLSVYVNPTQFGPGEDYEAYPRALEADLEAASRRGAHFLFAPDDGEMYPVEPTIWVEPGRLARRLCGLSRPTHFRGVLTVVAKLFGIVEPDVAVFGRKDYQQAILIQRMVRELHMPVRIEMGAIVRDADGVALSSRNAYLDAEGRRVARSLSAGLRWARSHFARGVTDPKRLIAGVQECLESVGARVDYVEIVDPEELEPVAEATATSICAVAAWVGEVRLIDNASLGGPSSLEP